MKPGIKKPISIELQTLRFYQNIDKLVKATGRDEMETLKVGVSEFAHFTAKETMPDDGKLNIQKKWYSRIIAEMVNKRAKDGRGVKRLFSVRIKKQKKPAIFRYGNAAKIAKYKRVDYRGVGRAGWFLNVPRITGIPYTPAEEKLLQKSPKIRTVGSVNVAIMQGKTITIENNATDIQRYARIAMAQGYRAAKNKINRERLKFLAAQESKPL